MKDTTIWQDYRSEVYESMTRGADALLHDEPCSWAPLLDQKRVPTRQTPIQVALEQLKALRPLLGDRPVTVLADRAYATPEFLRACLQLGYQVIVRIKSNRKLYRPG